MMRKTGIVALMMCASLPMWGASGTTGRMDRTKLNIGTYFLQPYARTENHVRELKECGIDFVTCMENDRATLDLFSKYGVGAIVTGILPGWWGGDGDRAGQLSAINPLTKYDEAAQKFEDHPAVWGIDIGDEPSALDFPYYGEVYQHVQELFPNQFPYINLYPNYASVSQNNAQETVNQLGTPTYEEHIAEYCKHLPADYLCYDFYLYSINVSKAYENLRVVADACLGTGRSMWIVLQVNSNKPEEWITENGLRFQAFTAMAFGTENITWGCYTAGWWHNQVLDAKGEKTEQYEKLKRVNAEIHTMAEPYMKYRRVQTDFVGFEGTEWLADVKQGSVSALNNGIFQDVRMTDGSPVVIGSMNARNGDGSYALFACSADDPYDKTFHSHTLRFRADGRRVIVTTAEGSRTLKPDAKGYYQFSLAANGGAMIEAISK